MTTSCKDVMQLRNSARKTKSQMRMVDRSLNRTKKQLGLDKKKSKETETDSVGEGYAPLEQKNMLNSYGYLYDALNGKNQEITSSNFYWDSKKEVFYIKKLES